MEPAPPPVGCALASRYRHVDFAQDVGPDESPHDEAGGAGAGVAEVAPDRLVDGLAVGPIADVDAGLHQVLEPRARLLQQLPGLLHRVVGLASGVGDGESGAVHGPAVEVGAGLAAQEDLVAGVYQPAGVAIDLSLAEPVPGVHHTVLAVRAGLRNHRLQVDLDLHVRQRQSLDHQPGAHRVIPAQVFRDLPAGRHPEGGIGEVGGDHGDVVEARPRLLQQHPGILHRLVGLGRGVGPAPHLLIEVEAGLAPQEDPAARLHGHAHVAVVAPAGVDVTRVELSEALNPHRCLLPVAGKRSVGPELPLRASESRGKQVPPKSAPPTGSRPEPSAAAKNARFAAFGLGGAHGPDGLYFSFNGAYNESMSVSDAGVVCSQRLRAIYSFSKP